MIWLKILLSIILAIVIVWLQAKASIFKSLYIPAIIIAVGTVLISYSTDFIDLKRSNPKVKITVNTVKDGELLVSIIKKSIPVQNIKISIPILGKIINIHDLSDITDRRTVTKQVVGHQEKYSQNNVEIDIENVSKIEKFDYKILFEPISEKNRNAIKDKLRMFKIYPINEAAKTLEGMLWLDRFSYSYEWNHKGNTLSEKQWTLILNNEKTTPPPCHFKGFNVIPKAISAEEVKSDYQQSVPIHKF